MTNNLIISPSVILIAEPKMNWAGVERFAYEQGLMDLPKLMSDTPIGRILDHVNPEVDNNKDAPSDGEILVEFAGRQCYSAWRKGRDNGAYINNILETAHGSVLAHAHFSFAITGISRNLSLELNRHSAGVDISQESQRFVNASDVNFVVPPALLMAWKHNLNCQAAVRWYQARLNEVEDYLDVQEQIQKAFSDEESLFDGKKATDLKKRTLIQKRANETARGSLPGCCETKGVWTFNYRALRHILTLRGAPDADLEIRRFASVLAQECKFMSPSVFADVEILPGDFNVFTVSTEYAKP